MVGSLRQLQQIELEILLEFKQICEKYGLTYYIVAGTLLGAVRHKGFIPWDDDIDIAMPRKDFDKFLEIGQKELSEDYFLQSHETDEAYFFLYAKIRKNHTLVCEPEYENLNFHKGVYIDIFPLDYCSKIPLLTKLCFKSYYVLNDGIRIKKGIQVTYKSPLRWKRFIYSKVTGLPITWLFFLREGLRMGMNLFFGKTMVCTLGGRHGYPSEVYETEWLGEGTMLLFEGHSFSAPKNWDAALRNMYGEDYMIPQKEEQHFSYIQID